MATLFQLGTGYVPPLASTAARGLRQTQVGNGQMGVNAMGVNERIGSARYRARRRNVRRFLMATRNQRPRELLRKIPRTLRVPGAGPPVPCPGRQRNIAIAR